MPYLLPADLAEIVCGLLVQPTLMNELKTPASHKAFMQDIGELVAKHCGGQIDGVIMPEDRDEDSQADYLTSPDVAPYIVVSPSPDMHSLKENVWRHHVRDGWLDHIKGSVEETPEELPTHKECAVRRYALQRMLLQGETNHANLPVQMVRMREYITDDVEQTGSPAEFNVTMAFGGHAMLAVKDMDSRLVMALTLLIENGVPSVHVNAGDTDPSVLQIRAAHGGMVLSTDSLNHEFGISPSDQYTYGRPGLLVKAAS
ncbi:hypothetical protein P8I14_005027 [Escherichia coli]|nr:hypothetical protein [Escherichia coli]MXE42236.1 hypothetical protein [Escherichia sp. HH41S]ELO4849960.1 hypothetical protein [Escherichia coli]MBN6422322.1 hypothetical protein [Escherichia coli]HAV8205311.1 hypothetical protein [Escherichia coli]